MYKNKGSTHYLEVIVNLKRTFYTKQFGFSTLIDSRTLFEYIQIAYRFHL